MFWFLPIAARNLARNRRRTALTLSALALGVMAVVGVRGFLNGLQASLILGVVEGGEGALQVHKRGFMRSVDAVPLTPDMEHTEALLARIAAVEGVRAVAPRIPFAAMVNAGDDSPFARVLGTDPVRELEVSPRRKERVVDGRWLAGESDLLLGMELAEGLGIEPEEKVALLTNDRDGVMNAVEAGFQGQLAAGTHAEKKLAVISLQQAQELLRMEGRITEVAVAVDDLDEVDAVKGRLEAALGPGYEVHTWKDLAPFAEDARELQDTALGFVVAIFLFIILMGIANTLLMSVMERVREIGTMMAVGARRRQVLGLFIAEGATLGVLGAALGSALGTVLVVILGATGVRLLTPGASVPELIVPYITPGFLVGMVALGGVGAALFAVWPAWKASRLRPAVALTKV